MLHVPKQHTHRHLDTSSSSIIAAAHRQFTLHRSRKMARCALSALRNL